MQPVSLITIHHEGAGQPVDWARGGGGGYSLWIGDVNGDGVYDVLRNPWISFATLRYNHVSLDICLSGDRMVQPVTDRDVDTIRRAVAWARSMGWVVDNPLVRDHHDSPGSSTVCPGTNARNPVTWAKIVAACIAPTATPIIHSEETMASYPSLTKQPNKFRGAVVDLAAKHVTLENGAVCNPVPVVPNANPWLTSYGGPGHFTIVTANDLDEYHFDLP